MTTTAQAQLIEDLRNTDMLTMRDDYQYTITEIASALVTPDAIREYRATHPGAGRADAKSALISEQMDTATRLRDEDWDTLVTAQTCSTASLTTAQASDLIDQLKTILDAETLHGYQSTILIDGRAIRARA